MKTLIVALTLTSSMGTFAKGMIKRTATAQEQLKYNLQENVEFESILERLKKNPMAIITNTENQFGNESYTNMNIELSGINPHTQESCDVIIGSEKNILENGVQHITEGFFIQREIAITFPNSLKTTLNYRVSIADEKHPRRTRELGDSFNSKETKTQKNGQIDLYKSDLTPKALGNQTKASIRFIENDSLLVSAQSIAAPFTSSNVERTYESKATCLIQL